MKDNLRNRFKEENFDLEPFEGHEHRFETKLMFAQKSSKQKTKKSSWFYLLAAACFLGVIVAVALYHTRKEIKIVKNIKDEKREDQFRLADISLEAAYKEKYFKKEIKKRENFNTSDPIIKPLIRQLNQLEKDHEMLENKLRNNINNEHLIDALLNNYKIRLEVLEKLQKIIHFKNKTKDISHEKNSNTQG